MLFTSFLEQMVKEDLLNKYHSSRYTKEEKEEAMEIPRWSWVEERESLKTPEKEATWYIRRTEKHPMYGDYREPECESTTSTDTRSFLLFSVLHISSSPPEINGTGTYNSNLLLQHCSV